MQAECTFTNQGFDSLIPSLKFKRFDAVMAGMDITPERATQVGYDSYQNAILDLKNGRVDAVFGDTAVVNEWLKENAALTAVGDKVTDKDYFGSGLGIAMRLQNTELQGKFNAALDKIKQDGTYETIYKKWFQQ